MEKRRGLRSLIPTGMIEQTAQAQREPGAEAPEPQVSGAMELPLERILRPKQQPRQSVPEEGLAELVESVRQHGILQPLVVRPLGRGQYELVAGERRYQAARRLGLKTAPVVVREASDEGALELALVENLQREDINPMEAAAAYQRLIHEFGLTQEKVAERVGKSRATVSNTLRLLNLPREVQESLRKGEIEEGHGRTLAALQEPKLAVRVWRMVVKRKLSVQQTQTAVNVVLKRIASREAILGRPKSGPALDPVMADLERKLTLELDARVKLRPKGKGGVMEVHYATWEELDYIVRQILSGLTLGRREARDHIDER